MSLDISGGSSGTSNTDSSATIIDSSDLTFTDIPGQPTTVTPVDLSNISANSLTAFFTAGKKAGVTVNSVINGIAAAGSAITATAGAAVKGSSTAKPGSAASKASGTLFGLPIIVVVIGFVVLLFTLKNKR